jgi:hypothetical protein
MEVRMRISSLVVVTIALTILLSYGGYLIIQPFDDKHEFYKLLKQAQGKKSSEKNDKIKITGNCIPDNTDLSKVDFKTAFGKPNCSEMNMTPEQKVQLQQQKDLQFYETVHWKLYYGPDGKVLQFEQMHALNSCVIMESPTMVFMNNKKIADDSLINKLYNPDSICLDAANSYFVPKGYMIKEIGSDGIGHQTVTLTK